MPNRVAVLLVDDRPENLVALKAVLDDQGLDLVTATSGNDTLRHTLRRDFALVLLDVQMPGMNGFETAELMRANPKTRHLPIIFVTGMRDPQLLFKGYDLGAVDYLIKPFEPYVLQSKVKVFCELYLKRSELEDQHTQLEAKILELMLAEEKIKASYQELSKLTVRLEMVREEEQKRIARELHDEMGSVLTALNIHIYLLAQEIPDDMGRLRAEADGLAKLVASGIQAMRQVVARLRPCLLDEAGLKGAIENHVEKFRKMTGIRCQLHLEDLNLDSVASAALFRIVQEALTNVAKYAEASDVIIMLSDWGDSLILTIKDLGKGFDIKQVKAQSFGLVGIRERAAHIGGKAEIISSPGNGTTVRVSVKWAESTIRLGD